MGLIKMEAADFETFGLISQNDANLDKESGEFSNNEWMFDGVDIATDGNQFVNTYKNGAKTIYLVSNKIASTIITGNKYTSYEFYKDA
tara:strand:- start:862 stop:1125 length:264 start_codon:yes stop_codon:yes gene_type:complete